MFNNGTSQAELFEATTLPLVRDLLEGKNGLLFAYGNTGSGKTYTIQGRPSDHGVLPRTLHTIFSNMRGFMAKKFSFAPNKRNGVDVQVHAPFHQKGGMRNGKQIFLFQLFFPSPEAAEQGTA